MPRSRVITDAARTEQARDTLLNPERLDELLLYRLSIVTRSASRPMVRIFEGELGITRRHWHLLALVTEHGGLSPSCIGELAGLDRPRVSRAVADLRAMGLVERSAGRGRSHTVTVTDAGAAMYERAFARVAAFNASLASVISAEDRAVLDALLARLQQHALGLSEAVAQAAAPAARSRGGSRRVRPVGPG